MPSKAANKSTSKTTSKSKATTATSTSTATATTTPAPTPQNVSSQKEPVVVKKTLDVNDDNVVSEKSTEQTITPTVTTEDSVTLNRLRETRTKINDLATVLKNLTKELTLIEKEYNKERNVWIRKVNKRGRKNTSLSGFAKPGFISPELCSFLNVEAGTEMAHTDVTKNVINYIKEHQLQDEKNRRIIIPDDKLSGLLQPGTTDTITFFNLQTFMKHHYLNPNKVKEQALAAQAALVAQAALLDQPVHLSHQSTSTSN